VLTSSTLASEWIWWRTVRPADICRTVSRSLTGIGIILQKLTAQVRTLDSGSLDVAISTRSRASTRTNCQMRLVDIISMQYLEYARQLS
jgi:hypothetical protein